MNARYEIEQIGPKPLPVRFRQVDYREPVYFSTHSLVLKRKLSMDVLRRAQAALRGEHLDMIAWRRTPDFFGMSLLMPIDTDKDALRNTSLYDVEDELRSEVPSLRQSKKVTFETIDYYDRPHGGAPILALLPSPEDIEKFAKEQQKIRDILARSATGRLHFLHSPTPHVTLGKVKSSPAPTKKERNRMRGIVRSELLPLKGVLVRPDYQHLSRMR